MIRRNLDWILILVVWIIWAAAMTVGRDWGLFIDDWFMSVTMAIGSFVAGSTSMGGGAVAFPVMTLGFDISARGARDFSMMIQSVGMTSASVAIFVRGIAVERMTLLVAGLAGALGVVGGIEWIQPLFAESSTKVFFVSLWLAFGFALWRINHLQEPRRRIEIGFHRPRSIVFLAVFGFFGGVITSLLGSGLDMFVFAMLVLGFRLCETVATPTSVILMASNSLVGFCWRVRGGGGEPIAAEIWEYWLVCVPIVAIGAPMGAKFISKRGHQFVVRLLLFLIGIQFLSAALILDLTPRLVLIAGATFGIGILFFSVLWRWGRRSLAGDGRR